jgi:ABC-type oligopeptide transport system substrate-binding subunit
MKSMKKIIPLLLIVIFSSMILGACSSSKKMKKKCLDCPEFSLEVLAPLPSQPVNENI